MSAPLNASISCSSPQTLVLIALNIRICDNKIQVFSLSFIDFLCHKEEIIASLFICLSISRVSIFSLLGELINASWLSERDAAIACFDQSSSLCALKNPSCLTQYLLHPTSQEAGVGVQKTNGCRPLSPCLAGAQGVGGSQGSQLCVLGVAAIPEQWSFTHSHTPSWHCPAHHNVLQTYPSHEASEDRTSHGNSLLLNPGGESIP